MQVSAKRLSSIRDRIPQLVRALLNHPLWERVRSSGTEILLIDNLEACLIDGILVRAAPDLVFGSESSGWTIVDWKTGRATGSLGQLSVYGLFLNLSLGLSPEVHPFRGVAIGLSDGTIDEHLIGPEELELARAELRRSVAAMRSFLLDSDANQPKDRSEFPMTSTRRSCNWCEYRQLCLGIQPPD